MRVPACWHTRSLASGHGRLNEGAPKGRSSIVEAWMAGWDEPYAGADLPTDDGSRWVLTALGDAELDGQALE
jgi:hypothetical protein